MNTKNRQFPLPLSSVIDKSGNVKNGAPHSARIVMPQTAMQNAAQNTPTQIARPTRPTKILDQGVARTAIHSRTSNSPYGADGLRREMVSRVAQKGVKDSLVLAALDAIPRHLFIESGLSSQAYIDEIGRAHV